MCLMLLLKSKAYKAKEDILCYKILKKVNSIKTVSLTYSPNVVLARIIDGNLVIRSVDGGLHQYDLRVLFDEINKNPLFEVREIQNKYVTPMQNFPVSMGITYNSNLIKEIRYRVGDEDIEEVSNEINIGIHSYCNLNDCKFDLINSGDYCIAECVIPKDSIFFCGKYGGVDCYASNSLKYIRIVE